MADQTKRTTGSGPAYLMSNVRKSGAPHEYVVTIMRDGQPAGEVKVRAPSRAPAYFNDPTTKKKVESAS